MAREACKAPKNGFFHVLDRLTGEFISSDPFVETTWARAIDQATGRPIETPEARYGQRPVRLAPSNVGAHHWQPMAYNPDTGQVYSQASRIRGYSRPRQITSTSSASGTSGSG